MARHRAGVAEAEVHVVVAVYVSEVRTGGLRGGDRERAGPLRHPGHRHAAEQRSPRPLEELRRARMGRDEALLLLAQKPGEAGAVDSAQLPGSATLTAFV